METINLLKSGEKEGIVLPKRKIGIINFSTSTLNQDRLQAKIHIDGLFSGIFYNPGDEWKSFKILKGEIPKVEELMDYNTIILSGSSLSVNKMPQQMQQFQEILAEAMKVNKNLKVVGLCFGHQFLAHSQKIEVVSKPLNRGLLNINFSLQE